MAGTRCHRATAAAHGERMGCAGRTRAVLRHARCVLSPCHGRRGLGSPVGDDLVPLPGPRTRDMGQRRRRDRSRGRSGVRTRFATETQFGHVARPVHRNTSWDDARFEVCQHRWLHVAEAGSGVAIANDTAYGVAVHALDGTGTDVGISLLRGAQFPDPDADRGRHSFRFSVAAARDVSDAVRLGYRLAYRLDRCDVGRSARAPARE